MSDLAEFYTRIKEIHRLRQIGSLLNWDQQLHMPAGGQSARAEHIAAISTVRHEKLTDPRLRELVEKLSDENISEDDAVNLREVKRELTRKAKLPLAFVAEKASRASSCYHLWAEARRTDNFALVKKDLTRLFELAREESDLVGFDSHPYDALLDIYDPYASFKDVKGILLALADGIREILPEIIAKRDDVALSGKFNSTNQRALTREVLQAVGYDFNRGRLDEALHPFCCTLSINDVRITTRYCEDTPLSSMLTALHEYGHALYEMGLPEKHDCTPLGDSTSLSTHEAMSRLWENIIGRSRAFSKYLSTPIKKHFPKATTLHSPDGLFLALNDVTPSLIRVEADEVTYSLHIVIRMILEEQLILGDLSIADLPGAWNELYEKYLEMRPSSFSEGVLQDVHWYTGNVGYFPTYALGNLHGAMMYEKLKEDVPNIEAEISEGNFSSIRTWLDTNVHSQGKRYSSLELTKRITGNPLSELPFLSYLKAKFDV